MPVSDAIQTYLEALVALCPAMTDEELRYMESGLTLATFSPKQFYLHADTLHPHIGFVTQGLLRAYYVNQAGDEVTIRFIKEKEYATHYTSFITQTPSRYSFQCLEPTVLVNLSYAHIQQGYLAHPGIERYGRLVAEEVLKAQQRRIESFLFDSAEQRYLAFVRENPNLFNRVSLSHLATYLGIERPSLSRIRKKLSEG